MSANIDGRRRKKQQLKKKLIKEEMKNEAASVIIQEKNKTIETLRKILESDKLDISPQQMVTYSDMLASKAHQDIDVGYIKTLLFPELYNSDVPQPLSCSSYSRFCDKREFNVSSGTNGSGMLIWYPKVNYGPTLFLVSGTSATPIPSMLVGGKMDCSGFFSQTCLAAASISIQYVGQLQTEQGYIVGSQLYGIDISTITSDEIENGQFRVISKPGEGVRLVFLPKDSRDFNYYPVDKTVTGTAPSITTVGFSGNAGAAQQGTQVEIELKDMNTFDGSAKSATTEKIAYQKNADCIAIYWKGLKQNDPDVLRIDTVRRFNALPKSQMRDFLDLIKPKRAFDSRKTIDVVTDLQLSVPQLAGHSIKQMDRISDQIQAYIPNIGHLYTAGMLKEGVSLGGFANKLALEMTGNEGFPTYAGRIWDND